MALFNPKTRSDLLRRASRRLILLMAGCSVLAGAMVGGFHYEEPFLPQLLGVCAPDASRGDCEYSAWLDVAAGVAATVAFGAVCFVAYRLRRLSPTVFCRSCGGCGWIVDLQPSAGRCPSCGHGRFRYRARELEVDTDPFSLRQIVVKVWDEVDVSGETLLALKVRKGSCLD